MYLKINILKSSFFILTAAWQATSSFAATPINELSLRSYYEERFALVKENSAEYAHRTDCRLTSIDEKNDNFIVHYNCLYEHTAYEEVCYITDRVSKNSDKIKDVRIDEECELFH